MKYHDNFLWLSHILKNQRKPIIHPSTCSLTASHTFPRSRSYVSSSGGERNDTKKVSDPLEGWETVIGLEIHAQLRTQRKLFSRSLNSWDEEPNTHVLPFDAAFPGTLPVINKDAVRLTLMTALALNCNINPSSTFDRKHYFYHDIPASYQITQHYNPIATAGYLTLSKEDSGVEKEIKVGIQQLQIEQDTAKTSRQNDGSAFVDLNRAGTGLMEIVTDADMRSPEEAAAFIRKLQSILRRLGSSDGDMEKGSMRVDANVSIHRKGTIAWGNRCEIKNLNSVRFMMIALDYERKRHLKHYLSPNGTLPISQETRGFNESTGETFTLRTKEDAEDYRYMPDSNLPGLEIDEDYLSHLSSTLPELPSQSLTRLSKQYQISKTDVETLINMDEVDGKGIQYFEDVVRLGEGGVSGKKVVNWIINELQGQLAIRGIDWTPSIVEPKVMADLVRVVESGEITGASGKTVLKHILDNDSTPISISEWIQKLGLSAQSSDSDLLPLCQTIINRFPKESDSVRKGNEKVVMRLVGEVMRDSGGRVDARKAREVLLGMLRGE